MLCREALGEDLMEEGEEDVGEDNRKRMSKKITGGGPVERSFKNKGTVKTQEPFL